MYVYTAPEAPDISRTHSIVQKNTFYSPTYVSTAPEARETTELARLPLMIDYRMCSVRL